jgi:hypothetical protein
MAEDDKYVPSEGNKRLDPTSRALDAERQAYEKKRDAGRAANVNDLVAHQSKSMAQDGLEYDSEGTLRSSGPKGYQNSFDYRRKEQTKAERAHITERTWGKYNRGETLDMYGNKMGTLKYVNAPQRTSPPKKSDITRSEAPDYGQLASKFFTKAAGPVASGLMPWISRFSPAVCGPVRVALTGFYGGVIQSNAQEAINGGFPVKVDDTWGK